MDKFDASVTSGIFRLTRIDTNENEWIVDYSFENDFVCDYPSLILNYYGNFTHFGKQPDTLKHLVLCEVLQIEKPVF